MPFRCVKESGNACEENEEGSLPDELELGEFEVLLLLEDEPEVLTFSANGWLDWPVDEWPCEDDGGS